MSKILFTSANHLMTPMILFTLLIFTIFSLILLRLHFKINYFEPITGNPNLNALKYFLQKKHPRYLLKYGNCSVLSFKITSLNRVNQTYGYEVGDELIILYSTRIKRLLELLGINHYFSTIRDNTFIMLVYGLNEDELLVYTEKIIAKLDMSFLVSKYEILTHTTAGIAIITETTEIYKHGKVILAPIFLALEKAFENYQKTNKSSYYVYNETLKNSHDLLRERFIELDTAIKNNEFEP
ncbi:MAG: diguanylate cyclase domain-containing protein, partial [Turicibacter sp.]